jgi:hypothetical protein
MSAVVPKVAEAIEVDSKSSEDLEKAQDQKNLVDVDNKSDQVNNLMQDATSNETMASNPSPEDKVKEDEENESGGDDKNMHELEETVNEAETTDDGFQFSKHSKFSIPRDAKRDPLRLDTTSVNRISVSNEIFEVGSLVHE